MLLVLSAIATMLWIGGQDVIAGRTSAGELAAFIFYAFIVAGSVGSISEVVSDLQRAAGATERLVELLSAHQSADRSDRSALPLDSHEPAALEFRSVDFVVSDAIVCYGFETGRFPRRCGRLPSRWSAHQAPAKTTLFDLAQRFYDPTGGRILIDGVDLRRSALRDVRRQIGFVPQDPVLFAGSVLDNLRYGAPDADAAAVRDALAAAGALTFVEAFPDGVATRVGEGGVGLSGGQRQRLAIARAI